MGAALALVLVLADATDQEFLLARLKEVALRYEKLAARQSTEAVRERAGLVREIAHLPYEDRAREAAGRWLGRVLREDRAYRLKAEAARALGRVGTAEGLTALYEALFGPEGRDPAYEMIHAVLPVALEGLRRPADLEWIALNVLDPAAAGIESDVLRRAGPLRERLLVLTLEGVGRARTRALGPEAAALARAEAPAVRAAAVRALGALELMDAAVAQALADAEPLVRAAAAGHPHLAGADARRALADPAPLVRRAAVRGQRARTSKEAITLLIERLAREPDGAAQLDLLEALNERTGKDFGFDAELWRQWWEAKHDAFEGPEERDESGRAYFFDVALRTRRVTFVLDVSASMSREDQYRVSRLEHAAAELERTIPKLAPGARFCLYVFASEVTRHPEAPGTYRGRERADWAAAVVRARKPAGATNTYGALMQALEDPFAPDTIVLLSDGNPYRCAHAGKTYSEHEQILSEVRRVNASREVRIHAVALLTGGFDTREDADSAAAFLRRLAAENHGEYREIR